MADRTFNPKRGLGAEARMLHIEEHLASLGFGTGTGAIISGIRGPSGSTPVAEDTGDLSGDVEGNPEDTTVVGLQTVAVAETAPTTGQLLGYDGTNWTPTAGILAGDATGALSANTVEKIQNRDVQDVEPDDRDLLSWVDADDHWTPQSGYRPYLLQGWVRNDVTAAPASLTEMPRWDGTAGNKLHGELPLTVYRLNGLRVLLDAPLNVNGSAYFCEVYIAGVATGFTREWIGHTAGADTVGTEGVGDVTTIRSGYITVYERVTGSPNAVRAQASVEIES